MQRDPSKDQSDRRGELEGRRGKRRGKIEGRPDITDAIKPRQMRKYHRRSDVKVLAPAFLVDKDTAQRCVEQVINIVNLMGIKMPYFVDPYAFDGCFLDAIPTCWKGRGYSLRPGDSRVYYGDYLDITVPTLPANVFIGRPPHEEQSLAVLNKALTEGGVAAFILPREFKRFDIQSQVKANAKLVFSQDVEGNLFRSSHAPKFTTPHVLQVWTTIRTALPDRRIKNKPKKQHPDFTMRHYTGKGGVAGYLDEPFDFAIDRGGAKADYSKPVYTDKSQLDPTRQYILFKAHSQEALKVLLSLDFESLMETGVLKHMRYLRATDITVGYELKLAEGGA